MNMNFIKFWYVVIFLCSFSPNYLFAFDKDDVHPEINLNAAEYSIIERLLKEELGFIKGLDTVINDEKIVEWLQYGGSQEDAKTRALNHFHDPLENDWDQAGGIWGRSAILWAQDESNNSSWRVARENYWSALQFDDKEFSDYSYAKTFQSLGQVMHLVSDMAVPAHVRNDAHPEVMLPSFLVSHFENYTEKNFRGLNYTGVKPSKNIFDSFVHNDSAPDPISALFDTVTYDGTNPASTLNGVVGLAEYTNANFFSEGTLSLSPSVENPPNPSLKDDTNFNDVYIKPEEYVDEEGTVNQVKLVYRNNSTEPLAAVSYCVDQDESGEYLTEADLILNDAVYKSYASKLVPKAVGYSTALLDYFFRGKLEVEIEPVIVRSDVMGFTSNFIQGVRVYIKNMTEDEAMKTGGTLFARYVFPEDGAASSLPFDIYEGYNLTTLQQDVLFNETSADAIYLEFLKPLSLDEIAEGEEHTFVIAFKGGLGDETNGVIGKVNTVQIEKIFDEEWQVVEGSYSWQHSTAADNYDNGETINIIDAGALVKKNIRYADDNSQQEQPRYNGTTLDMASVSSPDGLPIKRSSYISYLVNEMSIENRPEHPDPGYTYDYQNIRLMFSNGLVVQLFNEVALNYGNSNEVFWRVPIGEQGGVNIISLFEDYGIAIPDQLYLETIRYNQQLLHSPDSPMDVTQTMEVDFLRIIDWKSKGPENNG